MPDKRKPEVSADRPPLAALQPAFEGGMDALLGLLGVRGSPFDADTSDATLPAIAGQMAGMGPMLKSLGKPVSELLNMVLKQATSGTGLPQKLKFTNVGRNGMLQFHPEGSSVIGPAPFEATAPQVDKLIAGGALDLDQPPQGAVDSIRARLAREFDAAVGDPRNPTIGIPRENKTPMRRRIDELPESKQPRKRK